MCCPDNYSLWEDRERQQEAWLARRPKCVHCNQPIQDERVFDVEGELYHVDCFNESHLKWTEDYIE